MAWRTWQEVKAARAATEHLQIYVKQGRRLVRSDDWARFRAGGIARRRVTLRRWGSVVVSVAFLGMDHNWLMPGRPPLLYEVMVFGGPDDGWQVRLPSKIEALQVMRRYPPELQRSAHARRVYRRRKRGRW